MTATTLNSVCPRCGGTELSVLAVSPVAGVWEVRKCDACGYYWRTTEPARRSDRAHYPDAFKIAPGEIARAVEVPVIPPLAEH